MDSGRDVSACKSQGQTSSMARFVGGQPSLVEKGRATSRGMFWIGALAFSKCYQERASSLLFFEEKKEHLFLFERAEQPQGPLSHDHGGTWNHTEKTIAHYGCRTSR